MVNNNKENGRYYIKCNSAETDSYAVVQLTDAELKAVYKFLNAPLIDDMYSCFSGNCYIVDNGYDTEEEARDAIIKKYLFD